MKLFYFNKKNVKLFYFDKKNREEDNLIQILKKKMKYEVYHTCIFIRSSFQI